MNKNNLYSNISFGINIPEKGNLIDRTSKYRFELKKNVLEKINQLEEDKSTSEYNLIIKNPKHIYGDLCVAKETPFGTITKKIQSNKRTLLSKFLHISKTDIMETITELEDRLAGIHKTNIAPETSSNKHNFSEEFKQQFKNLDEYC